MKSIATWPTVLILFLSVTSPAQPSGTIFSTVIGGGGLDYATAVTSDSQGNTYVAGLAYSPDFPVTKGASQTTIGALYYPDAFVAKVGPTGNLIWATYLGGTIDDWATGIALDSSGNVWVTGQTRSNNFPVTANALQGRLDNSTNINLDNFNTFVSELSPDGSKLLYSTYVGNGIGNGAAAMAIDSANNLYLAINATATATFQGVQNGSTTQGGVIVTKFAPPASVIYSFVEPLATANAIAVDSSGAVYIAGSNAMQPTIGEIVTGQAVVFKVSPDGSKKIYEKDFGGSYTAAATAIAVDSAGEAWVAGYTGSADFPLVHPLQSTFGARPIWESTNGGSTWSPIDNLPFAIPKIMVVDPTTPATLYEGTGDLGIFKSTNGGSTWAQSSTGITGANITALAIDPLQPQTLYAASGTKVYKSTNGGASWSLVDTAPSAVSLIQVEAVNDNNVYELNGIIRKSANGGSTWINVTFPASLQYAVIDPQASGHLFAVSNLIFCGFQCSGGALPYLWTSTDGGNTWTMLTTPPPPSGYLGLLVDPSTKPSTVYDGLGYRSSDGGVTWNALPNPPFNVQSVTTFNVDPAGNLYTAVTGNPNYVSHDHGNSWTAIGAPTPNWSGDNSGPSGTGFTAAGSNGTLYEQVAVEQLSGFLTRLSADGSTLEYSTYLDGHTVLEDYPLYEAEPAIVGYQNTIDAIALDSAGNVIVAGGTRATDFQTANPIQSANAGGADAFAARISPDGSTLLYSTCLGGSLDDAALAAGIDSTGNVILAGQTWSTNFPGAVSPPLLGDSFVTKLATAPPVVTSVLSAASYQPGIEAGSWVMIRGANLSNTTRPWQAADFSGNSLPTSLSGVSVTIDGKPAFVSYISSTQVNVQAPSDTTTGPVNVVVNNNGSLSAPFPVTLQAAAPAFFMYLGTSQVVATTLNYALVGDPSAVSGAAPAHPGDTVILWATGFGATTPTAPAGSLVTGAPATVTMPTVTVGGVQAHVISSVLTTGEAGLYQITIQIPAGVAAGEQAVSASIGGSQTATAVTILIANP